MRNFSSALMCIAFVYMKYTYKFHWIFLILILGALFFWEYPAKENRELLKVQIEESKARTENIRWNTELAKTTTKLNLATLAMMQQKK